jgi:hypothetical protein
MTNLAERLALRNPLPNIDCGNEESGLRAGMVKLQMTGLFRLPVLGLGLVSLPKVQLRQVDIRLRQTGGLGLPVSVP